MIAGIRRRYYLCELFDIPLYVDSSFAFLLLFFLLSYSSFLFGIAAALLLAVSVVAHELGHALMARAFGYRTADITVSLLGGCASLISLPRKAAQEFWTALAGPVVSFAISAIFFSVFLFVPIESYFLARMVYYMAAMNFMLGLFNLLPGFPMDGGRIFRSVLRIFLSRVTATKVAMWVGRAFAILLGLSGLHAIFAGASFGFIRILIAYMIWQEGYKEYLLAQAESSWDYADCRARVSPPPYGGDEEDVDVTRDV